jgi:hypothetical protein
MKSADGPAQAAVETRPSSKAMHRERSVMAALQNWLLRLCRLQFAREQFEGDIPMPFGGCVVDSAGEFDADGTSHVGRLPEALYKSWSPCL